MRRRRRLGASWRGAGTLKASGRRGLDISSIKLLLVLVVAVAGRRAFALAIGGVAISFSSGRVSDRAQAQRSVLELKRDGGARQQGDAQDSLDHLLGGFDRVQLHEAPQYRPG